MMAEETIEEKIQYTLETYVQPSVAMHGGEVSLDEWMVIMESHIYSCQELALVVQCLRQL